MSPDIQQLGCWQRVLLYLQDCSKVGHRLLGSRRSSQVPLFFTPSNNYIQASDKSPPQALRHVFKISFLIATVVRFKYIVAVPDRHKTLLKVKELENNLTVIAWTHVEIFPAILATSLIALRPLLKHVGELVERWRRGFTSSLIKSKEGHELSNDMAHPGSTERRDIQANLYGSEVYLTNHRGRIEPPHA
ncbi:hypothetical protein GGR58DRAFT_529424 [Xylaria digitata]|nr:hypothetical protein GGR58DRAFT_529424 [Xylaria digitata]